MTGWLDLMGGIVERGRSMIDLRPAARGGAEGVLTLCERLLTAVGEASGTALAAEILRLYAELPSPGRRAVLAGLATRFGPDMARLGEAIAAHEATPGPATASALHAASEPRRQELMRRLNRAPGGTAALVAMREDVLDGMAASGRDNDRTGDEDVDLRSLDDDMRHLFASWFNRGFLTMRRMDWQTPAAMLERIIRYEAVHAINGWDDLRRRIDPPDRRLYAFFHPALPGEPLIFVEVALTAAMPDAIEPVLAASREPLDPKRARVATFYSISNCQRGLKGISFGSFLIKQVAADLSAELPGVDTFVTLSPVPGFRAWAARAELDAPERETLEALGDTPTREAIDAARPVLEPLMRRYMVEAKNARGHPADPVARFHLGNGARLERLDWMGDPSAKGIAQSLGAMVNYAYVLADIERLHEAYANEAKVTTGPPWRRGAGRRRVRAPATAMPAGSSPGQPTDASTDTRDPSA